MRCGRPLTAGKRNVLRGRVSVADAVLVTGASRNTLKGHFRTLAEAGHLNRHGAGRGTIKEYLPVAVFALISRPRWIAWSGRRRHHWCWRHYAVVECRPPHGFDPGGCPPPPRLNLDFDATDTPLHGEREDRFFHGYKARRFASYRTLAPRPLPTSGTALKRPRFTGSSRPATPGLSNDSTPRVACSPRSSNRSSMTT